MCVECVFVVSVCVCVLVDGTSVCDVAKCTEFFQYFLCPLHKKLYQYVTDTDLY